MKRGLVAALLFALVAAIAACGGVYQDDLDAETAKVSSLQSQLSSAQSALATEKTNASGLESQLGSAQTALDAEKANVSGLESQLASAVATPEPQPARTLNVKVGAGRDTEAIIAFLPARVRIRAGDTATWKLDSDEIHTVTFLSGAELPEFAVPVPGTTPGAGPPQLMFNPQVAFPTRAPGAPVEVYSGTGYINSGVMSDEPAGPDAPPNNTFSLTFDKPGNYRLICAIHPFMGGMVEVEPSNAAGVPGQSQLDGQARQQLAPLSEEMKFLQTF